MKCIKCGHENRTGHDYCEECGAKLLYVNRCKNCGHENKHTHKFCEECGEKVAHRKSFNKKYIIAGSILIVLIIVSILVFSTFKKPNIPINKTEMIFPTNQSLFNKEKSDITQQEIRKDENPTKGDRNASVTIIEFSDFECKFCGMFYNSTLPLIEKNYIQTGKVKLIFRNYPLSFHPNAQKAAEAAECAYERDMFWEYHNKLYENQKALSLDNLKQYAKDIGLDTAKFDECLDSGKMESKVKKDFAEGQTAGVQGTPAFFINGVSLVGAQPYSAFEQVIENELNK